jgi:hypothetical protein
MRSPQLAAALATAMVPARQMCAVPVDAQLPAHFELHAAMYLAAGSPVSEARCRI